MKKVSSRNEQVDPSDLEEECKESGSERSSMKRGTSRESKCGSLIMIGSLFPPTFLEAFSWREKTKHESAEPNCIQSCT